MNVKRCASALALAVAVSSPAGLQADDGRLRTAAVVLTEMTAAGDSGVPKSLLVKAKCVAVIPSVIRAALGFGGQYGRGYISCRDAEGAWSAPAGLRIEGGSFGLQIGASGTDLILAVLNERGAEGILSSQFAVGADAGVAAGPVGRQAAAQTDATMQAQILAWSRSRGVYAGISLQGSTLRQDNGENRELYGREIPNKEIVSGSVTAPAAAAPLMKALADLTAE